MTKWMPPLFGLEGVVIEVPVLIGLVHVSLYFLRKHFGGVAQHDDLVSETAEDSEASCDVVEKVSESVSKKQDL